MTANRDWLNEKIAAYVGQIDAYKAYSSFLHEVLERACRRLAPGAIVQCRIKPLASFAEKLVRKQARFSADPNYHFTDLCGARVVTPTSDDKELMCEYIRRSSTRFLVDWPNSLDVKSRLNRDSFGYLSVHFVVQIPDGVTEVEGIPVPPSIAVGAGGFKAEIQVRTFMEHAWAVVNHDRVYKAGIEVPDLLQREGAALAATIEKADERFLYMARTLDSYMGQHCAYLHGEKLNQERDVLSVSRDAVLTHGAGNKQSAGPARLQESVPYCIKLARLARSTGDMDAAIRELEPIKDVPSPLQPAVRLELGHALCLKHRTAPRCPEFLEGQKLLQGVVEIPEDPTGPEIPATRGYRAEAARILGWSFSLQPRAELKALDAYEKALRMDAGNPYLFAACISYETLLRHGRNLPVSARNDVRRNIESCRTHAQVGIEVPRAWFTMGRLYLLLEDRQNALRAYLKGISLALAPGACVPHTILDDEMDFLQGVSSHADLPEDYEVVRRLIELAISVREGHGLTDNATPAGVTFLQKHAGKGILWIAGGAAGMDPGQTLRYRHILELAMRESEGVVLCGGTRSGIPGLVGELAEELQKAGTAHFRLLGYLPRYLPKDAPKDDRYEQHGVLVDSPGKGLSEIDPIQAWTDIVAAGIPPSRVRLLGVDGGPMAGFEYRLAFALGATVGVVEGSGREADALLRDPEWRSGGSRGPIPLPEALLDRPTLRAFVRPGRPTIPDDKIDLVAEKAHLRYLNESIYSDVDPVRKPYAQLRADLKDSNRQQVSYAAEILASEGFELQPVAKGERAPPPPVLDDALVRRMAMLEHGRWNVERLAAGWRYGRTKNVEQKTNPCLVSWEELERTLPKYIKYDEDAIRGYASLLADAGFAIVARKTGS